MKKFLAILTACALYITVLPVATVTMLSTTGCTFTKAQLIAYASDVDQSVSQIATALGDTALAAEITTALNTFDQAVNLWQGGSVADDVISASKILELALGAVGLPQSLVAVADIAINVIDTIIASLPAPTSAVASSGALSARVQAATPPVRPTIHRPYKSRAEAVAAWNKAIAGSGYGLKAIK